MTLDGCVEGGISNDRGVSAMPPDVDFDVGTRDCSCVISYEDDQPRPHRPSCSLSPSRARLSEACFSLCMDRNSCRRPCSRVFRPAPREVGAGTFDNQGRCNATQWVTIYKPSYCATLLAVVAFNANLLPDGAAGLAQSLQNCTKNKKYKGIQKRQ